MKVRIRHQRRDAELEGPRSVQEVLQALGLNPETVIVIRRGELLTRDAALDPDDEIEVRPVVSGGLAPSLSRGEGRDAAVIEVCRALHDV